MKKKLGLVLLVVVCSVAALVDGCLGPPPPREKNFKFVDNIENAWWSADSKSLFYRKEVKVIFSGWKTKLFRYDVATGKRRAYNVPKAEHVYCFFADDKRVVFSLPDGIYTMNPNGRNKHRIYSSKSGAGLLCKLPDGRLMFTAHRGIYLMSPNGKGITRIAAGVVPRYCSPDGKGFLYIGSDQYYHFRDLRKGADKRLDMLGKWTDPRTIQFIYLSSQRVIYYVHDRYGEHIGIMNLETTKLKQVPRYFRTQADLQSFKYLERMKVRRVFFPLAGDNMGASPNLTKYWVAQGPVGEWTPPELYVVDIPPHTIRELRGP